ncbi:MAG: hypothetical protein E7172_02950 [Firmicutes bacterium]|nr:hypothetical protein [Bacillota bacterium]
MTDNNRIFENIITKYPQLRLLKYQDDYLIYNNDTLFIGDWKFSNIDEKFYQLSAENLFIFLKNKFYIHDINIYSDLVNKVNELFKKIILTEEDIKLLQDFAHDFWLRKKLFLNEEIISKDINFVSEFTYRNKVFILAQNTNTLASIVLIDALNEDFKKDTQNAENNLNQGLSLTKTKEGIPKLIVDDINGFTNIILIIGITVVIGIIIGFIII